MLQKKFLCNAQYIYIVGSDMFLNSTHRRIFEFPLQQWLHESATMLSCTYTDCVVEVGCNLKDGRTFSLDKKDTGW